MIKEVDMSLTEIGEITLCDQTFKLGKNGKVVLVVEKVDAWGKLYGEEVDLWEWLSGSDDDGVSLSSVLLPRVQAILDELGDKIQRLRQQRDSKLKIGQQETQTS